MRKLINYAERPEGHFSKIFWNIVFFMLPMCILLGVLSLLSIMPVLFNEKPYYGIKGFLILIVYIPFFSFIFSGIYWVMYSVGNYFMKLFLRFLN